MSMTFLWFLGGFIVGVSAIIILLLLWEYLSDFEDGVFVGMEEEGREDIQVKSDDGD